MNKQLIANLREYFMQEVSTSGDDRWYVKWWGICKYEDFIAKCKKEYGKDYEFVEPAYEDDYECPTHILMVTSAPSNCQLDDGEPIEDNDPLEIYIDNIHGDEFPIVIEGDTVRAWGGLDVEETLPGGASLYDEEYYKAKEWISTFVSDLIEENVDINPDTVE